MRRWAVAVVVLVIAALLLGREAEYLWRQAEYARREESAASQQAKEREEAARRLEMAQQAVAPALAEASKARDELHALLQQPGGVYALLDDPERWRRRLQPVRAAVERAQAACADFPAAVRADKDCSATLQRALDEAGRDELDRHLALRLERIRVGRFTIQFAGVDQTAAARAYPQAFAEAGIAIHDPATSVPAAQIATSPIRELLMAALDDWAVVALHFRQHALLEQLLAVARCADPDPLWRDRLRKPEVWHNAKALTEITNQAPANLPPQLYCLLASLSPSSADSERLLRDALARYPADFWLNFQLASAPRPAKLVETVGYARAAVAARPHEAAAYNNLACLLSKQGLLDDARVVCEQTLSIQPRNASFHRNHSAILLLGRRPEEALAAMEKAISIDAHDADAHDALAFHQLGQILSELKRHEEAAAAYREALKLDLGFTQARDGLAAALKEVGRLNEQTQKALAVGQSLLERGEFEKALAANDKTLESLPPQHELRRVTLDQRRQIQQALIQESKLVCILDGREAATPDELLELAKFCQSYGQRHVTALQLYRQAFHKEPSLIDDLAKDVRYHAACAAARAGVGTGPQAAKLSDAERAGLRRQALAWLRADLDGYAEAVRSGKNAGHVEKRLTRWQKDEDLFGVRDPRELPWLPEDERELWRELWAEVQRMLEQAKRL